MVRGLLIFSISVLSVIVLSLTPSYGHPPFLHHVSAIREIEDKIQELEDEIAQKEKDKMTIRSAHKVEDTLNRIIEIHGELIGHRRDLEIELGHVRSEHPEEGRSANLIVSLKERMANRGGAGSRRPASVQREVDPLYLRLNAIFRKVQRKYASFIDYKAEETSEKMSRVNAIVREQRGARKDKEAQSYIKKKGQILLTE